MTHLQENQDLDDYLYTDPDACPSTCTHDEPCDNCGAGLKEVADMNDLWDMDELLMDAWDFLIKEASARGIAVFDMKQYNVGNFIAHAYRYSSVYKKSPVFSSTPRSI